MKIRIIHTAVLFLFAISVTRAQQLPQFSQYMNNLYVINPAASSMHTDIDLNIGYRQQWAGFEGAPQTYYLSGTINLGKTPVDPGQLYSIPISHPELLKGAPSERFGKHVVGGLIASDQYGLFERTSIMGSYSYHHPVGEKYWIAVGASMGWYGLNFQSDDVVLENPTDNTYNDFIANGNQSNLFDINAGVIAYSDRAFIGYSVYQLGRNEIELGNEDSPVNFSETRLDMHHYFTGGYKFAVSNSFNLTPSFMFKLRPPAPLSVDINLMAEFNERIRLGLSYRNEDAVAIIAGVQLSDWMRAAYSYDYITSEINDLSSGSHEIVLGFQFNRKK